MNNKKKYIIGILMLIFVFITIIVICLNMNKEPVTPEPPIENPQITKRFERVKDYEEFFNIQSTLNDFGNVDISSTYTIKELFVKSINNIHYYFINACKFSEMDYVKNEYYILILDKSTKSYELSKINENITNLEDYAKNYDVIELNIKSSKKLISNNFSTENLLVIYMEYFKQLLIYDPIIAYNLLTDSAKSNYFGYEDFNAKKFDIYNNLSSQIFSFYEAEQKDSEWQKIYYFEDNNRNKVTIYEEDIMNFKISY